MNVQRVKARILVAGEAAVLTTVSPDPTIRTGLAAKSGCSVGLRGAAFSPPRGGWVGVVGTLDPGFRSFRVSCMWSCFLNQNLIKIAIWP